MPHRFEGPLPELPPEQAVERNLFESPTENYPEADLERWKQGAEAFRRFWQRIPQGDRQVFQRSEWRYQLGELQALFLGEKPAVFSAEWPRLREKLKAAGLETAGEYVYDPKAVAAVIKKHPDVFGAWKVTTPQETMAALHDVSVSELPAMRGLVLGYPLESVRGYEQAEELKILDVARRLHSLTALSPTEQGYFEKTFARDWGKGNSEEVTRFFERQLTDHWYDLGIHEEDIPKLLEELKMLQASKDVDVYGVGWVDYGDYPESRAKQARLKAAFEQSGILDVLRQSPLGQETAPPAQPASSA